jgi:hypothetical protein
VFPVPHNGWNFCRLFVFPVQIFSSDVIQGLHLWLTDLSLRCHWWIWGLLLPNCKYLCEQNTNICYKIHTPLINHNCYVYIKLVKTSDPKYCLVYFFTVYLMTLATAHRLYGGRTKDYYTNLEGSEWMQQGEPQNVSVGTDWLRLEIQNRKLRLCWKFDRDIQRFVVDAIPAQFTRRCW